MPLWLPDDATGSFVWLYAVATDGLWRIGDYCVEVRAGGGRMGDKKLLFEPVDALNTKSGDVNLFFCFCSEIDLCRLGE